MSTSSREKASTDESSKAKEINHTAYDKFRLADKGKFVLAN